MICENKNEHFCQTTMNSSKSEISTVLTYHKAVCCTIRWCVMSPVWNQCVQRKRKANIPWICHLSVFTSTAMVTWPQNGANRPILLHRAPQLAVVIDLKSCAPTTNLYSAFIKPLSIAVFGGWHTVSWWWWKTFGDQPSWGFSSLSNRLL